MEGKRRTRSGLSSGLYQKIHQVLETKRTTSWSESLQFTIGLPLGRLSTVSTPNFFPEILEKETTPSEVKEGVWHQSLLESPGDNEDVYVVGRPDVPRLSWSLCRPPTPGLRRVDSLFGCRETRDPEVRTSSRNIESRDSLTNKELVRGVDETGPLLRGGVGVDP